MCGTRFARHGSVEDILRLHSFRFGEDPNDFVDDHEEAYGLGLDLLMWNQEERLSIMPVIS